MTNSEVPFQDSLDIKELIRGYAKHWIWFFASMAVFVALAFIYLRYKTPEFVAQAKIQILDEQNSGGGIDLFKELDFLSGGKTQVEDEIEIINSRSNFIEVARDLGLNTKLYVVGNIMDTEIYDQRPVKINFIAPDSVIYSSNYTFYLNLASSTTFGFTDDEDKPLKVYAYGKNLTTPIGDMLITPDIDNIKRFTNKRLRVEVRPLHSIAEGYRTKINISTAEEYSNIVNFSLEDPIMGKARDIINRLIRIYNRNAIEDKKVIADRTSNFIDDRISASRRAGLGA